MLKENLLESSDQEKEPSPEKLEEEMAETQERIKGLEERLKEVEKELGIFKGKKIYTDQSRVHITEKERNQEKRESLH